jgi:hypothetical protein
MVRGAREWDTLFNLRARVQKIIGGLKGFGASNDLTLRGAECSWEQSSSCGPRLASHLGRLTPLHATVLQIAYPAGGLATRSMKV